MANLYEASAQWANRPDDERFSSLEDMYKACKAYAEASAVAVVPVHSLRADAEGSNVVLVGAKGVPSKVTHYAFGQLSRIAGAPPSYLRGLPAKLAADCVNEGLKSATMDKANLLFHRNGSLTTRAITSESYDRVWNHEVISDFAGRLARSGWVTPPARPAREGQRGTRIATAADILPNQKEFGLEIKVGDKIAPAGLYASDHDMFAFLVNQSDPVWDGSKFMHRGVFIRNSEVGDCALWTKFFTYDNVCGNHIVWGVGKSIEISVRHVKGENVRRGRTLSNALAKWHVLSREIPSAEEMGRVIVRAKTHEIAASKEEVFDALVKFAKGKSLDKLNRKTLEAGYDIAERTPRYGSPRSVWGMVNGLTEYSQTLGGHTDARTDLDTQAGRIMEIAF